MKQACFGLLVLFGLQFASAQVPFFGPCPNVTVQQNFDLNEYTGVWYEYEKYPFVFEVGRKCMYATYEITGDDTISVVNSAIGRFSGRPSNVTGWAKVVDSGRLAVNFPNKRNPNRNHTRANYEVLGTDYTSYAVVYGCSPIYTFAHTKLLWVLTRERNPPESVIQNAEAVIDANRLKKTLLLKTSQTGCEAKDDGDEGTVEPTTASTPESPAENLIEWEPRPINVV